MSPSPLLLYGASGYTGALIARLAVHRWLRPILAWRQRDTVAAVAAPLGLEYRVLALDDAAALDAALAEARAVLHCAGPFTHTSRPMADACPFCAVKPAEILIDQPLAVARRDTYPVNKGHTLIIPRRHVVSSMSGPTPAATSPSPQAPHCASSWSSGARSVAPSTTSSTGVRASS